MIMNAAGTVNLDLLHFKYDAIVTKSVTVERMSGNTPRINGRMLEFGYLNNVGIRNPGLEDFSLDDWDIDLPIVVSVWGHQAWEYVKICRALEDDPRVMAFELNLSCPNVLTHPNVPEIVGECCNAVVKPVYVKFSILNDIQDYSYAQEYGASALTLINTIPALDINSDGVILTGGLSGPAIKPIALRAVYDAVRYTELPIIGCGGIGSQKDVEDYMAVGAKHVQIGTNNFYGR